jgi:hypothetical protein
MSRRNPPPAPSFNKTEFYVERIDDLLDTPSEELDDTEFADLLMDIGIILQRWLDATDYRKRKAQRYD